MQTITYRLCTYVPKHIRQTLKHPHQIICCANNSCTDKYKTRFVYAFYDMRIPAIATYFALWSSW